MSLEWTLTVGLGTLVLGGVLYAIHMFDERKWARDAKRQHEADLEWDRTHPAE
jgi:hypothetical protein